MTVKIRLTLVLLVVVGVDSLPQPKLWDIYTNSEQPFVNVVIAKYESDILFVKSMEHTISIHQDSIKYLIEQKDSKFAIGMIGGLLLGGIVGVAANSGKQGLFEQVGSASNFFGAILIGGVLGGGIGAAMGSDTKYYLQRMNTDEKRKLLNYLYNR